MILDTRWKKKTIKIFLLFLSSLFVLPYFILRNARAAASGTLLHENTKNGTGRANGIFVLLKPAGVAPVEGFHGTLDAV